MTEESAESDECIQAIEQTIRGQFGSITVVDCEGRYIEDPELGEDVLVVTVVLEAPADDGTWNRQDVLAMRADIVDIVQSSPCPTRMYLQLRVPEIATS